MPEETLFTSLCPVCHRSDSLVSVKEIAKGYSEFVVESFCTHCNYANKNGRTGSLTHKMLSGGKFDRGKTLFLPDKTRELLYDLGVEYGCTHESYHKAFAGILEYAEPQKRNSQISIPVYNTWNYVPGNIRISKSGITFPARPTALAGLMANTYKNDLLYICEKPIDALSIRTAAVDLFCCASAVLIPLRDKYPPLAPLVSARKAVSFVRDRKILSYLKKELPEDTIYVNGLDCERGRLSLYLRKVICG